jgi:hypothetical protein
METDVKAAQPVYQVPPPPTAKVEGKEVVYTAGPGDPLAVTWHHHRFVNGVPVMVRSEHILGLVDGNPSFSFKGQDKAKELAAKQAEDAKVSDAERAAVLKSEAAEMEARHKREADAMAARHKIEADRLASASKDTDAPAPVEPAAPATPSMVATLPTPKTFPGRGAPPNVDSDI